MSKIPKLRFKEFSGEWESKKLGELLEFKNGINALKEQYGHGKKFINVLDILNNDYITHENIIGKVDIDDDTFEKYSVGYGDVVFQRSSETREEVGTANIYLDKEHKATFGGFIIRGKKVGEYSPIFMNKLLKTSSSRKEITSKSGGSTRYNVGQETLSEVSLLFPKLEEQEKIASFFSLIDDKISLQGEKVEALKDYKKGMMQKIFSRELRFKDDEGRDYPEWEEKKLGDIVSTKKKGKNPVYAKHGNVLLNNEYMENSTEPLYVENEIDINTEDILILWDGSQAGKMYTGFTGVLGSTFVAITLDKNNCNSFTYQQLIYNLDKIQIAWREGSGVPHVAKDFIENFKIKVPVLEEQRKISKVLDGIDVKLRKEQEKLDFLNEYKKGLLQQMFI